jgi:hypothetical protein
VLVTLFTRGADAKDPRERGGSEGNADVSEIERPEPVHSDPEVDEIDHAAG